MAVRYRALSRSSIADSAIASVSYVVAGLGFASEATVDELHRRMVHRIREAAQMRNIPLSHLPDRAGVSKAHFFDVMAGRKSPTIQWLSKLAEALDIDTGDFFVKVRASSSEG
jgi:ribosome-binding protein aMBF1 (putative translation factor)